MFFHSAAPVHTVRHIKFLPQSESGGFTRWRCPVCLSVCLFVYRQRVLMAAGAYRVGDWCRADLFQYMLCVYVNRLNREYVNVVIRSLLTVLDSHECANRILYALRNSPVFRWRRKDMTDSCLFRSGWQSVPSRWSCNSKATRTVADSPGWSNDEVVTHGWAQTGFSETGWQMVVRSGNMVRDCANSWTSAHLACSLYAVGLATSAGRQVITVTSYRWNLT